MNKSNLKGLWIPPEILINNNLADKEKIILSFDYVNKCIIVLKVLKFFINSDRIIQNIQKKSIRNIEG